MEAVATEALVICKGIALAAEIGLTRILVENDSSNLIRALRGANEVFADIMSRPKSGTQDYPNPVPRIRARDMPVTHGYHRQTWHKTFNFKNMRTHKHI